MGSSKGVPVCIRVSGCVCVAVFPGFDGKNEVRILNRAGFSFLPLPWPEASRAWSRKQLPRSLGWDGVKVDDGVGG